MYRYRNPTIGRLERYQSNVSEVRASYLGISLKALYYAALTMISAAASFLLAIDFFAANISTAIILLIGAPIIAFICAMIAAFAPRTAPVTGSLYAVFQGLTIGFISLIIESAYSGVVFSALISTVSVLVVMLVLYFTGIIRVGAFFRKFMISALLGIVFARLIIFVIGLFSPEFYAIFYGVNSTIALLLSIGMVIFASLFILLDLQRITEVVENGLDKIYEWSAAFGLLVTLVWLYMEFLRLFAYIAARRK